jgi:hypothetical protein
MEETRFISEQIRPVAETIDTSAMVRGEPGLPRKFVWRGKEYTVDTVLEKWKEYGDCTSGSDERYLRKHWFLIRTTDGHEMKIYFERQAKSKREVKTRWWLYTLSVAEHT